MSVHLLDLETSEPTTVDEPLSRLFDTPEWRSAKNLAERAAAMMRQGWTDIYVNHSVEAPLSARVSRWKQEPQFAGNDLFEQMLSTRGLSEIEFSKLLGMSHAELQDLFPVKPDWLNQLEDAYTSEPIVDGPLLPEGYEGADLGEFLELVAPLIRQGRRRVREGAQALLASHPGAPFDAITVEKLLFQAEPWHLRRMMTRTLVLELHVAKLEGRLAGDSAESRFQSFVDQLRDPIQAIKLLREYPVLARALVGAMNRWVNTSIEFLTRLCDDHLAIRETFASGNDIGMLSQLSGRMGDSHRGGRSVLIAQFDSGFRVVYKPKSLAVDQHFQELLAWVNERGSHPPFRITQTIDRTDYGWVEFIPANGCETPAEVERFFERQGAYLALLYALEATDFHCENLIASGEHPVLLDLEALFHPRLGRTDAENANELAGAQLSYSVLRVGLLPERVWRNGNAGGVDVSGWGAGEGQLSPFEVPYWESAGTDEVHLARKRMVMLPDRNRPTLLGAEIPMLDYRHQIEKGFVGMYRTLLEQRDALLAPEGPLAQFREDEVRMIVRATQSYSQLLDESFHPDVLRDATRRDRHFDRLWLGVRGNPVLSRLVATEQAELWNGDIPMFTTKPSSRDLWNSEGGRIENYLAQSGYELVQNRMEQLSHNDLTQQLWIVKASLASTEAGGDRVRPAGFEIKEETGIVTRERLLNAAVAIGDQLSQRALRGKRDASWLGLSLDQDEHWFMTPLAADLYDGLSGIALYLGYLGRVTGRDQYTELARAALSSAQLQVSRITSEHQWMGGFDGLGGVIYASAHLAALWQDDELLAFAEQLASRLPAMIARDEHLDMISGSAGCIGGLKSLYALRPATHVRDLIASCARRISSMAIPTQHGIGWRSHMPSRGPLTGFSHGAAGMAWALLQSFPITGDDEHVRTAQRALEYERSLFSLAEGNWPDLRLDPKGPLVLDDEPDSYFCSWCHGAPGIGMARMSTLSLVDDRVTRSEIAAAIRTTMNHGFGRNHTLCHGDLGNLELHLQASIRLRDQASRNHVDRVASSILDDIDANGFRCAVPLAVEAPGLMTGLAGIGYGLLRIADPSSVPSVLMMEPPAGSSK